MKKLSLPDTLLLSIEKPERYIGNEVNAVHKDLSQIEVRFCMCFPDVYEIGMSHLGLQILYDLFNKREDTWCERVFSPWMDLDKLLREKDIPLFALESQDPVKDFDFLGITLQYEMCYTNVLQILDLSQIPLHSDERGENDPIVIGGGPAAFNPEPLHCFFDLFYIGEGEVSYGELLSVYKENRRNKGTRADFLRKAAFVPGIYVPSLYGASYNEDGTLKDFRPLYPDVPEKVRKQVVPDLSYVNYPEKPLIPFIKVTQDRAVLEVMRGCIRGCRFCQAGQVYKPKRERSLAFLKDRAEKILSSGGQDEISLSSLSTSDFSSLKELTDWLIEKYRSCFVNISLPSLRIDAFSLDLMEKVQDVKKSSLTFAPEAGSQRMRDVINKGIDREDILRGSAEAFKGSWNKVKLYFMLGLPTETDEDVLAIAELSDAVAMCYYDTVPKEKRKGIRVQVTSSASFFIPKPFTPFQWAKMDGEKEFRRKAYMLKEAFEKTLNHRSLKFQYHETELSMLEGALARGDRRQSAVIEKAYKNGSMFDAWSEHFSYENWLKAFAESGLQMDFYCLRERGKDELFPWDFIDIGVQKDYLYREWEKGLSAAVTPNCSEKCSLCGARSYGCGICNRL